MTRQRHTLPPAGLMDQDWPDGSRQARSQDAWRLRFNGLTIVDIADRLGTGRSTAAELLYDPHGDQAQTRRHKHHGVCVDCGQPTYNGGSTALPLPARCRNCEHDHPHTLERARRGVNRGQLKWADGKLLDMLRWAANHVDGPLTTNKYLALRDTHPFLPSLATIIHRLGWKDALARAGLPTSTYPPTSQILRRYTDAEILAAVAECWHERGGPPPVRRLRHMGPPARPAVTRDRPRQVWHLDPCPRARRGAHA